MAARFKVIATNDDADFCMCCGKQGLKRVVWLRELTEDGMGAELHVGTDCAAVMLGYGTRVRGKVSPKAVRRVLMDYFEVRLAQILEGSTFYVQVRTVLPPAFAVLRQGKMDLSVVVLSEREMNVHLNGKSLEEANLPLILTLHGESMGRERAEHGHDFALRQVSRRMTDNLIRPLEEEWYSRTGLKTSFRHELPLDLKTRTVRFIDIDTL